MKLLIENVRSFGGKHEIPLRPLTVVVGENSSGKSTLLGAIAAVANTASFPGQPAFNLAPFAFGGFDAIASRDSGRAASSFGIGYIVDGGPSRTAETRVLATYFDGAGTPLIRKLRVASPQVSLEFSQGQKAENVTMNIEAQSRSRREREIVGSQKFVARGRPQVPLADITIDALFAYTLGFMHTRYSPRDSRSPSDDVYFDSTLAVSRLGGQLSNAWGALRALAPIRTKPKRTYDIADDAYSPEGQHTPYRLRPSKKASVVELVSAFGKESGLFDSVRIKKLGQESSAPFQVLVDIAGESINISDVGYGVSQSLPIVVETLLADGPTTLLVQQPEVHLHPKAQAALGTFFARAVRKDSFVILETHSDYMLDRIRQEVANGTIGAKDIIILYTERTGLSSQVHELVLDRLGNILDAPLGYRQFFIEEGLRHLSRG